MHENGEVEEEKDQAVAGAGGARALDGIPEGGLSRAPLGEAPGMGS